MSNYAVLNEHEAAARISSLSRVDFVMHVSPDSDTLGCALTLAGIINENGGDARICCADEVPSRLAFLLGDAEIFHILRDDAAHVALDVASPSQLGAFADKADTFSLMIDHHVKGEKFADNCIEDAAACGEIVFRIAGLLSSQYGMRLPQMAATHMYAAISGDTGSFRFGNTTATSHMIAAALHEMGARTEWCAHNLHGTVTKRDLASQRIALENMKFFRDGKLAITATSAADMASAGLEASDFGGTSDLMRSIEGALVGVSIRENGPGTWRLSSRANVHIDCAAACAAYGGGGHTQAAGCTLTAPDKMTAIRMAEEIFSRAIDEYEAKNG